MVCLILVGAFGGIAVAAITILLVQGVGMPEGFLLIELVVAFGQSHACFPKSGPLGCL